jgi:hypothetical protein
MEQKPRLPNKSRQDGEQKFSLQNNSRVQMKEQKSSIIGTN